MTKERPRQFPLFSFLFGFPLYHTSRYCVVPLGRRRGRGQFTVRVDIPILTTLQRYRELFIVVVNGNIATQDCSAPTIASIRHRNAPDGSCASQFAGKVNMSSVVKQEYIIFPLYIITGKNNAATSLHRK